MKMNSLYGVVVCCTVLFSFPAFGQTETYKNEEYNFSMEIPPGYVQKTGKQISENAETVLIFSNNSTQEKIIIALNKNTDEATKAMYWKMFDNSGSGTMVSIKTDREGRVLSKRKIEKPSYEGFVTVSEDITRWFFLLQEVKMFPRSGPGSAIVGFLYRAQNHPGILEVIETIEYDFRKAGK